MTILDPVPRTGHAGHNAGSRLIARDVIAEATFSTQPKAAKLVASPAALHTKMHGAKEIVAIASVIPQATPGCGAILECRRWPGRPAAPCWEVKARDDPR
jgi:hypothetical protein